jgi:hypothetical protein
MKPAADGARGPGPGPVGGSAVDTNVPWAGRVAIQP